MRKTKPVAVKDVIDNILNNYSRGKASLQVRIVQKWDKIVPKEAKNYTRPISIKNKVLIVLVTNSAWLHQLTIKKNEILKKIKKIFHTNDILDIRFKIGT